MDSHLEPGMEGGQVRVEEDLVRGDTGVVQGSRTGEVGTDGGGPRTSGTTVVQVARRDSWRPKEGPDGFSSTYHVMDPLAPPV